MEGEVITPKTKVEMVRLLVEEGVSVIDAQEWAAQAFGDYKGGCRGLDKDGREWSMRDLEARGELKKVG
jgi:hypothetical protein